MPGEKIMALNGISHINIGCRVRDLPAIEKFYGAALGLTVGYRPAFPNAGLWLYGGERALVHVVARFPENWPGSDETRSGFDHIAFDVTGVEEFRRRLIGLCVEFDEQNVPTAGFQMFTRDPVGNKVELNFPNDEAPQSVAQGTLSKMQFPVL
jgi:catechol 2,3-dioxygenase-like lactoylglutathione lyase family enzyme